MDDRDHLVIEQTAATRKLNRGISIVVSVPVVIIINGLVAMYLQIRIVSWIMLINAVVYVFGAGSGGVLMIKSGAKRRRDMARQLRDFDERHQLPEARVVIR